PKSQALDSFTGLSAQAMPRDFHSPSSHLYCVPDWHDDAPSEYIVDLKKHGSLLATAWMLPSRRNATAATAPPINVRFITRPPFAEFRVDGTREQAPCHGRTGD